MRRAMYLRRVRPLMLLLPLGLLGTGPSELRVYELVAARSEVWVVTHKGGVLSFLGHEHAIVPTDWSATLCLADPVPAGAHGSITVRTASLIVDSDSARSLARLGGGPGADDRRTILEKMLDSAHLDVAHHPEVEIWLGATGSEEGGRVEVEGTVTLHGVTRDMAFPLEVREDPSGLRLAGDVRIRQRDFGIEPESIHGVVKVSNDVDLHFSLAAVPSGEACSALPGSDRP